MKSPDPQPSILLLHWQASWTSLVAVALELSVLAWYLASARRVVESGKRWPVVRVASFVVGMAVATYAVDGGIAQYERSNFTAHVVQLLLLVDVAPPLLAAGTPIRLSFQSSGRRANTLLRAALYSPAARALTQPLVAFGVSSATLYAYFLTPLYAWSERHPVFLAYVELQFFLSGCLLWWVVVARDAMPRRVGFGSRFALALLSAPVNAYLGLTVASASKPLDAQANTLVDTHAGGNVLWALAEVFIVAVLALLFVDWAREEEQKAVRADRQLDAALAAARAAPPLPEPGPSDWVG